MASNGDRYMAYVRGWRCGARFGALDPALAEHEDETICMAYADGWSDGRVASRNAFRAAEATYGYAPSILRACDEETTDDHES